MIPGMRDELGQSEHLDARSRYALIHSLHQAKSQNFAGHSDLRERVEAAANWTSTPCSYNSNSLAEPFGKTLSVFRCYPSVHFNLIVAQVIQMLAQDLVVILDGMMDDVLAQRNEKAGPFPQSKVEKLATHLKPSFLWAKRGCLELIAARNVLTHAGGKWNAKIHCNNSVLCPTSTPNGRAPRYWLSDVVSIPEGDAHLPKRGEIINTCQ